MKRVSLKPGNLALEIIVLTLGLLYISPVVLLFMNSLKSQAEMFGSFLSLPKSINYKNYITAWKNMHYPRALLNTVVVSAGSTLLVIVFSSMTSYRIARSRSKIMTIILFYFVFAMMMPFQTVMIPLMQIVAGIGFTGSLIGYIFVAAGLICPFTIYLYRGFYKQVPFELEEAARIDGANPFQVFFIIVFPLLKSVTVSAVIINVLNIWNDYLLAILMLQRREK
jgi:raffinose/stachyose/melibiose transport system permease protein